MNDQRFYRFTDCSSRVSKVTGLSYIKYFDLKQNTNSTNLHELIGEIGRIRVWNLLYKLVSRIRFLNLIQESK
jgi:hypothetical protein